MNFRNTNLLVAFVLGSLGAAASVAGCEIVASVDRGMIPPGTDGGGSGGASSASSSSASSSSGGGGGCATAADCPAMECKTPSCTSGDCSYADAPKSTPCAMGNVCDGMGKCVPPGCMNMMKDGMETDVDCGGLCTSCADMKACGVAADCMSGVCTGMVCQVPTCSDMVPNGSETDKDCGGTCAMAPTNQTCADGLGCMAGTDCTSKVCDGATMKCSVPTCTDMVQNGTETDQDCGGSCATAMPAMKCATGLKCMAPGDCVSGDCTGNVCQPSCMDAVKNQDETDIDCGGVKCSKCTPGKACLMPADCNSGVCTGNMCQSSTCMDMVQNQGESDVDCGGGNCAGCPAGGSCMMNSDCASNVCKVNKTCM
jgi:hypothetical protein